MQLIRTISLWQPWAHFVAIGLKAVETRHWATKYRGPLAIHAAKRPMDAHGHQLCFNVSVAGLIGRGRRLTEAEMEFGAVVAVVELTGCWPTDVFVPNVIERDLGNFSSGRFAWTLESPRRLAEPIVMRGRQGFFKSAIANPQSAIKL